MTAFNKRTWWWWCADSASTGTSSAIDYNRFFPLTSASADDDGDPFNTVWSTAAICVIARRDHNSHINSRNRSSRRRRLMISQPNVQCCSARPILDPFHPKLLLLRKLGKSFLGATVTSNYATGQLSCLSYLSCLFATLVHCGQTVGWIKMPLGTEIGIGPGDIVLDGNPAPPTERGTAPPLFGPCPLGLNGHSSQLLLSTWQCEDCTQVIYDIKTFVNSLSVEVVTCYEVSCDVFNTSLSTLLVMMGKLFAYRFRQQILYETVSKLPT